MDFTVQPLVPGQSVRFVGLELTPFCGEHTSMNNSDEWDTLPFFVRDVGGSGNFFSMVDITLTEQHLKWARAKDSRPVVVSWTNNLLDWSHTTTGRESLARAHLRCCSVRGKIGKAH